MAISGLVRLGGRSRRVFPVLRALGAAVARGASDGHAVVWTGLAVAALGAFGCRREEPPKPPPAVVEEFPTPPPEPTGSLTSAPVPPILMSGVGFESPESAVHDPGSDVYFISNINGDPLAKDDNGFISKVAPDGTLIDLKWLNGEDKSITLNAPKGLAIFADTLFVADLDVVRAYDRNSGKPLGDIPIETGTFLNDIAAGWTGRLFVSDTGLGRLKGVQELTKTGEDAIYVIDPQRHADVLGKGTDLLQPNGVLVDKGKLLVASWSSGEVYYLDGEGKKVLIGRAPGINLDGLVQTPSGRIIVTSWEKSAVYISTEAHGAPSQFVPLLTDLTSPADLGYDAKRRQLIIPLLKENALYIQELPGDVN
jgi:hypothetical protein